MLFSLKVGRLVIIFRKKDFEHVTSFDPFLHVVHFFTLTHDIVRIRCVRDIDSLL